MFECTTYCVMHCYQMVLLTIVNVAGATTLGFPTGLHWNVVDSGVMSFAAPTPNFRGKWNAAL